MINRISCIYHPSEQITNFCEDSTCLMPLCPVCISEHTEYHQDQNTRPQYCSISEIISDTHAQIDNALESLRRDQSRNGELIVEINMLASKIKDKINIAKEVVYRAIEDSFTELEKDILNKLEKFHAANNIYCLEVSEKKDKIIIEELAELQCLKQGLNSQRALSTIIYFHREKQQDIQDLHSQISTYLNTNENYHPALELNNEAIYSLGAVISRTIKISTNPKEAAISKSRVSTKNLRASQVLYHKTNPNQTHSEVKKHKNANYTPIDRAQSNQFQKLDASKSRELSRSNSYITKINTLKPLQQSKIGYQDESPYRKQEKSPLNRSSSNYKLRNSTHATNKRNTDENYEHISRKVAELRTENQRMSRNLNIGNKYDYRNF